MTIAENNGITTIKAKNIVNPNKARLSPDYYDSDYIIEIHQRYIEVRCTILCELLNPNTEVWGEFWTDRIHVLKKTKVYSVYTDFDNEVGLYKVIVGTLELEFESKLSLIHI